MNKRIKELFIQLFGKNNFPKGNAEVYMSADDLEVFAELIVRECMDTVIGFRNQFGDSAHDEIKEHFGVDQ